MTDPMLPSDPPSQVPVLTLTLNPALDMATDVPRMVPDEKLRCSDPSLDPGGGGINVARAIHALGGESLALVALGGRTGNRLAELLRDDGVQFLQLMSPGETRQSLTVTETATGHQFRFMMPGPVWNQEHQEYVTKILKWIVKGDFWKSPNLKLLVIGSKEPIAEPLTGFDKLRDFSQRVAEKPGAFAVISGSQPPGVPVDFPARLAAAMAGMRIVLDTSGSALIEAVERPLPGLEILRMDGEEAEVLAGRPLGTRAETADFAQDLVRRGAARQVIVARGADGSVLADAGRRLFARAPKVTVVSKVGAGDSFVGGFVLALARGQDAGQALAQGVAAAAAAVMTEATDLCRPEDVARLLADCPVSEV